MFNRILVPLDGSKLAECILPHLVTVARLGEPEVQLLSVLEPAVAATQKQVTDPVAWQIRKAETESYLAGLAGRLQDVRLRVSANISEGKSADRIIEAAYNWNADLIIMSSHGQSGISPWSVSSVAQQVIMRAHRSLMIVRAYQPQSPDLAELRYQKIFVPLDGSQRAEMSLSLAEALVYSHESTLLLAHIIEQPKLPRRTHPSQEDLQLAEQLTERNQQEAHIYMEDLKARLIAGGCANVESILEVSPTVARSLHRIADENDIDLTILSAHGYSGDTRWPFGNVVVGFITYGNSTLLILQDLPADRIELTRAEINAREAGTH